MAQIKKLISRWSHFNRYEVPDILASEICVPERVYIVACGPNGLKHYQRIPEDSYVIAANKAVLIPEIKPDMWILNSVNRDVLAWFKQADADFEGVKVFKKKCVDGLLEELIKPDCFCFTPENRLDRDVFRLNPKALCGGGTVSGYAIQIAVHLGARDITLCGVDMSGQGYWDGTSYDHPHHTDTWKHTENLNLLIEYLRSDFNLSIRSLSPTKINIPMV